MEFKWEDCGEVSKEVAEAFQNNRVCEAAVTKIAKKLVHEAELAMKADQVLWELLGEELSLDFINFEYSVDKLKLKRRSRASGRAEKFMKGFEERETMKEHLGKKLFGRSKKKE